VDVYKFVIKLEINYELLDGNSCDILVQI